MALTYRQTKGSALTIEELDANFQYFTGSHAITGSLVTSGSCQVIGNLTLTGSLVSSGSNQIIGDLTLTGSLVTSGSCQIEGDLTLTGSVNISQILTLETLNPLPSATNGSIAFSSSGDFYFASGSAWHILNL